MTVATAFGRAVDYERHAIVQREVAAALADRIAGLRLSPAPRVLEVGCGTGLLGAALVDRLPRARWLMTDVAPEMVERARVRFADRPAVRFATLDGERPGAVGSFELICSSLAAQWFVDLAEAVARLRGLLAPGGRLAFTTLAAGSFGEWRRAHDGMPCGTHDYPSEAELAALGLDVSIQSHTLRHADARAFLRALKAIGAGTPRPGYRPLPPSQLRRVMARFEGDGARATYQVATCIAEAPE